METVTNSERRGRTPLGGFWGALTEAERQALGAFATRRTYGRGEALCLEGDPAGFVVVILDGFVKVFTTTEDGHESVLSVRGPGDAVGELGTLEHGPRTATVTALERLTALVMDGERFRAYVESSVNAFRALNRQLIARHKEDIRRRAMGSADGERRLADLLCELSDRFGVPGPNGEIDIDLPLSQHELGSWAGKSREMVARAYHAWRKAGVIRNGRRTITIVDPEELRLIRDGKHRGPEEN